ncbi:hypothetical protein NMY22_g15040 [Coprinellus aureogranulatus]|nr:hypothetical protein NMY22_g15040 [Coprinellus aureogranulatus]
MDRQNGQEDSSEMRQASQTTLVDPAIIRPKVYYNDGPFDAPSSSDEEAESLLGDEQHEEVPLSPGMAELGGTSPRSAGGRRGKGNATSTPLRLLLLGIAVLVGLACLIGVLAAMAYSVPELHPKGLKITMDHIFNGTFSPERLSLHWVPEAGDGVFSTISGGTIKLVDLKTQESQDFVNIPDIRNEQGQPLAFSSWQVSPDMKYILVKADYRKQWRWSSFGTYYVYDVEAKRTHPIIPPSNPSRTAYATWSPTGQAIAFVTDNDLYILPSAAPTTQPIRVTSSGNASLFHGVPDWVYEEEVFSGDFALWWSPDSRKVAFLTLDETQVPEFSFPIYNPTEDSDAVIPYTSDVVMKYPKPGYPNPLVSVHVFDLERYLDENDIDDDELATMKFPSVDLEEILTLDWEGRHPVEDSVIFDVTWVANSSLIVKELNRNGNDGNVVYFELDASDRQRTTGKVVRKLGKNGEHGDDGWVENEQTIFPLRNGESGTTAYLDITPTPEGYNHIALFSPADSSKPHFLTSGEWEVTGGISAVDHKKGLVYFISTKASSTERHLYSVALPKTDADLAKKAEPVALTDDTKTAYYRASFSPEAGFYLLSYDGPNVPWQKVIQVDNSTFSYVLTTNEGLKNVTEQYEAPVVVYSTFKNSEGYELNVKEIRPPKLDDSGRLKYPVLFKVYGGPASQQIDQRFNRADWSNYVACGLKTIVVTVDGRGTGFKGRKLRNPVKGNLGFFETQDQIEAAREWAKKTYVDPKRIGIWGWSYGGFMSSKVAEADAGIHSLAMAVAPVTSWRLYDSIYTERYMNTPQLNPGGYVNASITNVTGFKHINYLLAHGSGDDNVHYANSAHLLDMFTKAQVRNYRFRMFTDSDHSISRRGANREVYEYLTAFLEEKWASPLPPFPSALLNGIKPTMRFAAFSSLVLSLGTLASAQIDLSNYVEVGDLPYRFQLAAWNTKLPNDNSTGAPLTLGAGGATGGISLSTSSTWNTFPYNSHNQSSIVNYALRAYDRLSDKWNINGTSVQPGASLGWLASLMYPAPQEKNAVYSAFVSKDSVDLGRHANGTVEPYPLLAGYNRTDLWSLCPDSYERGQTRLRFNVSGAASPYGFDPAQCYDVVVHMVSVEGLNIFA